MSEALAPSPSHSPYGSASHAVAYDEDRYFFQGSDILGAYQMVFPGVHSDVGGGWASTVPLQMVSLKWMINQGRAAGVSLAPIWDAAPENPFMAPHANAAWWGMLKIGDYGGFVKAGLFRPMIETYLWGVGIRKPMAALASDFDFTRVFGVAELPQDLIDSIAGTQLTNGRMLTNAGITFVNNVIDTSAFSFALFGVL